MRRSFKLVGVAAAALVSAACAGLPPLGSDQESGVRLAAERVVGEETGLSEAERELAKEGAYALLATLARRDREFATVNLTQEVSAEGLQEYILRRYGETTIEYALDQIMLWDSESKFDYGNPKKEMEKLRTAHFTLSYYPGTEAARDSRLIGALAEESLEKLLSLIAPEGERRARFDANIKRVNDGTISIILPPDSRYWKSFNATAKMTIGAGYDAQEGSKLTMSIGIPYHNSVCCATLTHEVTHMVDLLCRLSEADMAGPAGITAGNSERMLESHWMPILSRLMPHDTPLGEGVAQYAAKTLDPLHRLLLPSAEDNLRASRKRRPIRSGLLLASPVALNRKTRILQYEELHSFTDYLIERYGLRRFMDFYFDAPISEARMRECYGKGYSSMEAEWRVWLGA